MWGMKVIRKVVLKLHIICIYLINHIFIIIPGLVLLAVARKKKISLKTKTTEKKIAKIKIPKATLNIETKNKVPVTPALENFKQVFLKTGRCPEKYSPVLWGMKVIRKVVLKLHIIRIYLIVPLFFGHNFQNFF